MSQLKQSPTVREQRESLQKRVVEAEAENAALRDALRGVEIVQAAEKAGTPLLERTIRTALHRLKVEESIRNEDGRWFANEAAVAA